MRTSKFLSVTRFLFVATEIAAIIWVSASYGVALYSTIALGTPFPVEDLSGKAIEVILGVNAFKTVENIFEHNDRVLFGTSNTTESHEDNKI